MNILFIEASKDSPKVVFDPTTNIFEISGKSHPENVKEFFKPILEWLNNYLCEIKDKKDIHIVFNSFHTSFFDTFFFFITYLGDGLMTILSVIILLPIKYHQKQI